MRIPNNDTGTLGKHLKPLVRASERPILVDIFGFFTLLICSTSFENG